MTMTETPRTTPQQVSSRRSQPSVRRRVEQLVHYVGPAHSPSEMAIRSIHEKRSTPRW